MVTKGQLIWVLVFCWLLALSSHSLLAEEHILEYQSAIEVRADGALDIVETLVVQVEGVAIERGIFRDFPTQYRDAYGNNITAGFKVVSVRRNGQDEPYSVRNYQNGKRIRIGDANTYLEYGQHTYKIRYKTTWQITHLVETDELYFNAVGTGWEFPIKQATVNVTLPEGAEIGRIKAYTGRQGETGEHYSAARIASNKVAFTTNRPLPAYNGMTIVVEWPSGLVKRPSDGDKLGKFFSDNEVFVKGGVSTGLSLLFFLFLWWSAGRDPKQGLIKAQYQPPPGVSPAMMRHVRHMGVDHAGYATALVNMAVKGHVKIKETSNKVILTRQESEKPLSAGEQALFAVLFAEDTKVSLGEKYNTVAEKSFQKFKECLEEGEGKYFTHNRLLVWVGATMAGFLTAWAMSGTFGEGALVPIIILGVVFSFIYAEMGAMGRSLAPVYLKQFHIATLQPNSFVVKMMYFAMGVGFCLYAMSLVKDFFDVVPTTAHYAIVIVNFIVSIVFADLLSKHTMLARNILDQVEGFRLYLTLAEKDRLNFDNPPDLTPELFDAYLPYAIALDVENEWGEQFEAALKRVPERREGSKPGWYSSSRHSGFRASSFVGGLSSGLTGAIASASTPPSSSGSSGFSGGFSGGGGGGGGGGGW